MGDLVTQGSVPEAAAEQISTAKLQDELLRTITDALPVLVSYVGQDERYQSANRAYESWFGISRSQMLGRHLREVLGDAAYAEVAHHVHAALSGTPVTFQTTVRYQHGGQRFVEASYIPHLGPDGRVHGFIGLVSDITARFRADESRKAENDRDERLLRITAAIADAITRDQVYEAVVDQVAATLGASSAGLWLIGDNGRTARLVRVLGYAAAARQRFDEVALDTTDRSPVVDALRRGEPIWIDTQPELLDKYPQLASAVTKGRSYRVCSLPIIVRGRTLGALAFTFDAAPVPDGEQRAFLLLVARYAGQALERLRLLAAEQHTRTAAEAAAERTALLSRASRAFSEAGQDLALVLRAVAEQITGEHADGCAIALVSSGLLDPVVFSHRDPDATSSLRALLSGSPLALGEGITGRVAQSGVPVFSPAVDAAALLAAVRPEHRAWLERHLPTSLIVVPLRARGRIIGTLSALRGARSPAFDEHDLQLLGEIAERAAMAIESSRLYRDNQHGRLRAELLYGLAAKVIGAEHVEQVFEAALDAIERALGTPRSAILAFDGDGVMRFKASRGLSDEYRKAVEGHCPWARDERAPEPVLVADVDADPSMDAYLPLFRSERIGALGFIPLVAAGRLIGKFMVYYERPRQLSAHELEMAGAIANHVAAALNRFAAIAELQQTVRFNEMFAGVLGHDLRNPLNAIMMSTQLLAQRDQSARMTKPLSRIMNSGARMARMIDQLLDFTRVRVGAGIGLDPQRSDISALLGQVIDELEDAHPHCSLRLERHGDLYGTWDVDRLLQVFSNLVANAVQHGIGTHGVTVRADGSAPEAVWVEVHNMGAIPEALLPKLFEPMAGGERRLGAQGLGLGLYITREIVRAHGGRIETRSSEQAGTAFTVWLPRRGAGRDGST